MFDDTILAAFIEGFYGVGNYKGPYWFVGMEEGGHGDPEQISRRLEEWDQAHRPETPDFWMMSPRRTRSFAQRPRLQRTWAALIRMALILRGAVITDSAIRTFQRDWLGRAVGNNCLLELFPLPSPSTRDWLYGQHSAIPELRTRATYLAQYAPSRAEHIRARIAEHAPRVVIFYSVNAWYWQWWELMAGQSFSRRRIDRWQFGLARGDNTVFAVIAQPATRGITHNYFHQAAQQIALCLADGSV